MHTTSLITAMIQAGNIKEAKDLAERTGKDYDEIAANIPQGEARTDSDEPLEEESQTESLREEAEEEEEEATGGEDPAGS